MKAFWLVVFIVLSSTAAGAQEDWKPAGLKWETSCGADRGSIRKSKSEYVFKTSRNHCDGGYFKQRAEINSRDIAVNKAMAYAHQSKVSMTTAETNPFIFFQIHDGRKGCSPPLSVRWQPAGILSFDSDYTKGKGLAGCVENVVLRSAAYSGPKLKRDGTAYEFRSVFRFDGKGGFTVEVQVDGKKAIEGAYTPPSEPGLVPSTRFYFKHGVYSQDLFDYEMRSSGLTVYKATD